MADRGPKAAALARKAVQFEIAMWRNLYRWLFRRRRVREPGGQAFGYTSVQMPVLLAFIGASAVELPIVHLLLPWPTVRLIFDIIGAYGLVWMIGLLATVRVNPHVVSDAGLRVRSGDALDMTIPWDYVAEIRAVNRTMPSRPNQRLERTGNNVVLHLVVMSQTNVDIVFAGPTTVPLADGDSEPLTELRIAADHPGALVTMAAQHVKPPPRPPESAGVRSARPPARTG